MQTKRRKGILRLHLREKVNGWALADAETVGCFHSACRVLSSAALAVDKHRTTERSMAA